MEWISLLHGLPKDSNEILVLEQNKYYHLGYFHEGKFWLGDDELEYNLELISHWMPLPEPPKKD